MKREKERVEELAVRDWLKQYGELLAAVPRRVTRSSEKVMLAWAPEIEPPSCVETVSLGKDRGSPLAFGPCDAWRFTKDLGEKTWMRFSISTDCSTVFTTKDSTSVSRTLRRAVHVAMLDAFLDVQTGRHTLRLDATSGSGDLPYSVWRSNLPSPEAVAKVIAEQELARRR
ncbi:MAG TPA: hypothetical protein VFU16_06995 [Solirubrobacterales bacterium]|nr:hypothetical protein [Solirubrobacterales bacterium]